jgi:hypothetical protein
MDVPEEEATAVEMCPSKAVPASTVVPVARNSLREQVVSGMVISLFCGKIVLYPGRL